jgi:two-component system sensor histidine kinase BaeS
MLDQTRVIARLLNDLQTIATAEAGALVLHREPTDLQALIADVIASFTPAATKAGIALRLELTTVPELAIDPVRIRQVLDNLVVNALRYTPEGGHVALSLKESARNIEIEVRDTGRGMAPEEVGRMFERFAKSADSGGSGLGLAIARSLVDAHGGSITGTSEPGAGTTITITLPTASMV